MPATGREVSNAGEGAPAARGEAPDPEGLRSASTIAYTHDTCRVPGIPAAFDSCESIAACLWNANGNGEHRSMAGSMRQPCHLSRASTAQASTFWKQVINLDDAGWQICSKLRCITVSFW